MGGGWMENHPRRGGRGWLFGEIIPGGGASLVHLYWKRGGGWRFGCGGGSGRPGLCHGRHGFLRLGVRRVGHAFQRAGWLRGEIFSGRRASVVVFCGRCRFRTGQFPLGGRGWQCVCGWRYHHARLGGGWLGRHLWGRPRRVCGKNHPARPRRAHKSRRNGAWLGRHHLDLAGQFVR